MKENEHRVRLVVRRGTAAPEILRYLREHDDIDLVVMATHGRGGVARLMMGSVADTLVREAPCPVLTIRVPGGEETKTTPRRVNEAPLMRSIGNVGYWSGLTAFTAVVAYDVVQILQIVGVLRFPADEILIYGTSLCIVVPFMIEMLAFHHLTTPDKRFWTHAALIFTTLYAVFVTANYVVQLATVVPAKIRGTSDAIRILEQSPHSLFWDYDAVGYVSMGFACSVCRSCGQQRRL